MVPFGGGRPGEHSSFENVPFGRQFGRSVQADLRYRSAFDQLASVLLFRGILAAHQTLLILQGDVLVEFLLRILPLATPNGEGLRDQGWSGNKRHFIPREVVLLL